MNARASRILRRYCQSTNAPAGAYGGLKRLLAATASSDRAGALAALEAATNKVKKPTRAQRKEHNRANSRLHITPAMQVDLLKQAASLNLTNTQPS